MYIVSGKQNCLHICWKALTNFLFQDFHNFTDRPTFNKKEKRKNEIVHSDKIKCTLLSSPKHTVWEQRFSRFRIDIDVSYEFNAFGCDAATDLSCLFLNALNQKDLILRRGTA